MLYICFIFCMKLEHDFYDLLLNFLKFFHNFPRSIIKCIVLLHIRIGCSLKCRFLILELKKSTYNFFSILFNFTYYFTFKIYYSFRFLYQTAFEVERGVRNFSNTKKNSKNLFYIFIHSDI